MTAALHNRSAAAVLVAVILLVSSTSSSSAAAATWIAPISSASGTNKKQLTSTRLQFERSPNRVGISEKKNALAPHPPYTPPPPPSFSSHTTTTDSDVMVPFFLRDAAFLEDEEPTHHRRRVSSSSSPLADDRTDAELQSQTEQSLSLDESKSTNNNNYKMMMMMMSTSDEPASSSTIHESLQSVLDPLVHVKLQKNVDKQAIQGIVVAATALTVVTTQSIAVSGAVGLGVAYTAITQGTAGSMARKVGTVVWDAITATMTAAKRVDPRTVETSLNLFGSLMEKTVASVESGIAAVTEMQEIEARKQEKLAQLELYEAEMVEQTAFLQELMARRFQYDEVARQKQIMEANVAAANKGLVAFQMELMAARFVVEEKARVVEVAEKARVEVEERRREAEENARLERLRVEEEAKAVAAKEAARMAEEQNRRITEENARLEKIRVEEIAAKEAAVIAAEEERRVAEENERLEQIRMEEEAKAIAAKEAARIAAEEERRVAEENERLEQIRMVEQAKAIAAREAARIAAEDARRREAEENDRLEQTRMVEQAKAIAAREAARIAAEEERRVAEENDRLEQIRMEYIRMEKEAKSIAAREAAWIAAEEERRVAEENERLEQIRMAEEAKAIAAGKAAKMVRETVPEIIEEFSDDEWEESIRIAQQSIDGKIMGLDDVLVTEQTDRSTWEKAEQLAKEIASPQAATMDMSDEDMDLDSLDFASLSSFGEAARAAVEEFEKMRQVDRNPESMSSVAANGLTDWAARTLFVLREACKERGIAWYGRKMELVARLQAFDEATGVFSTDDDLMEDSALQVPNTVQETVDWTALTVKELKKELQDRNLPTIGKKADLVAALKDYDTFGPLVAASSSSSSTDGLGLDDDFDELAAQFKENADADDEDFDLELDLDFDSIDLKALGEAARQAADLFNQSGQDDEPSDEDLWAIESMGLPDIEELSPQAILSDAALASSIAFAKMTVLELKDELRKRGLSVSGKKTDLIERLQAHDFRAQ